MNYTANKNILTGLGYGMAIVSAVVCVYYNVIIAWALYYIYQSYSVSWSSCENSWNTPSCISKNGEQLKSSGLNSSESIFVRDNSSESFFSHDNSTESFEISYYASDNRTGFSVHGPRMTSSEEFWL